MIEVHEEMNVHDRDEENVNEHRNVRQRQPRVRFEPFEPRVDLVIDNINIYQGTNSLRSRQLGPRSRFISLENLVSEGGQHGTIMVAMILSISTSSNETRITQRSYNGARGTVSTVRHTRKITIMCLLSPPGRNTAIILQGNGISSRLFEDTETRDNGMIRKYWYNKYILFVKLLSDSILYLLF